MNLSISASNVVTLQPLFESDPPNLPARSSGKTGCYSGKYAASPHRPEPGLLSRQQRPWHNRAPARMRLGRNIRCTARVVPPAKPQKRRFVRIWSAFPFTLAKLEAAAESQPVRAPQFGIG